jgi:hypothetical protein
MAKPTFHGQLKERPFQELLLELYRWRLSGTLAVWPEQPRAGSVQAVQQDRIRIAAGIPAAALFTEPAPNLREGLLRVMGRTRALFAFYQEELVGSGPSVMHGALNVYDLLAESLRRTPRRDAIGKTLDALSTGIVRIRPEADLEAFHFRADELEFVKLLRAAPGELRAIMRFAPSHDIATRVLVLLSLVNAIEIELPARSLGNAESLRPPKLETGILTEELFGPGVYLSSDSDQGPRAVGPRPRATSGVHTRKSNSIPPKPLDLPPAFEKRWQTLVEGVLGMDDQDHFTLLGVGVDASEAEINAAYLEKVAEAHPDALPPALKGLRPWAHRYIERVVNAREAITSPETRTEYISLYRAGLGSPNSTKRDAARRRAEDIFGEAELLVLRLDWAQALVKVREARAHNHQEPRYLAVEAWCRFHLVQKADDIPELIAMVRQALAVIPAYTDAYCYLGAMYRRLGRGKDARDAYRLALRTNLDHPAARAALMEMAEEYKRSRTSNVVDFMRGRRK